MTRRKTPLPARLPHPAQGGSYIRDKDGSIAKAPQPAPSPSIPAPSATTETPTEE